MPSQLELFLTALQFLTRIPVPVPLAYSPLHLRRSPAYYPLVGALVGLLLTVAFRLCPGTWSPLTQALAVCGFSLLLTGAFHEDGWADSWDGLGGGWTRERVLEIMRDSRLGTFGVCALTLALAMRVSLWLDLPAGAHLSCLVWAHAFSRFLSTTIAFSQPYLGDAQRDKPTASGVEIRTLAIAAGWTLVLAGCCRPGWLECLAPSLLCLAFAMYLKRRLGGYNGDCLGANQLACELMVYAAWTAAR